MAITKVSRGLLNTGVSDSSDATAITIDSSENVMVGATSYNNDNAGVGLGSSGFLYATRDGSLAASFKRLTSTGSIADFRKDSSTIASVTSDGICFGSDSAAANALDDYEEGSWTPAIAGSTNLSTYNAEYIKIGRKVYAYFYVSFNPISNSNQFEITGLPYGQSGTHYGGGTVNYTGNANWSDVYGTLIAGSTIFFHKNSGTSASLTNADVYSKTSGSQQYLLASIHFYTA